jgi:hypothetical protein
VKLRAKREKERLKITNREFKQRKEALLTVSDWTKRAQVEFNSYIRERDVKDVCISCGRNDLEVGFNGVGGKWDAGHFRSRGAAPELRFNELNCHKQCKSCNGGSGKYARKSATVADEYRHRLIAKIGLDEVEWLEGPHEPPRYRIDDLKLIRDEYRRKLRELKKKNDI